MLRENLIKPMGQRLAAPKVTTVWDHEVIRQQTEKELVSFSALADVIARIQRAKVSLQPGIHAAELQRLISQHMRLKAAAYGEEVFTWKDHVGGHVPKQIVRDSKVFDTLPLERKHQKIKRVADGCRRVACFDKTVLTKSICEQLRSLETIDSPEGKTLAVGGATMSLRGRWRGLLWARDDIAVAYAPACKLGKVLALRKEEQQTHLIVEPLSVSSEMDGYMVAHSCAGAVEAWKLGEMEVRQAMSWYTCDDGSLRVIV